MNVFHSRFFLCRWRVQEEEHRHADKYDSQHPVEPTGLPATYVVYDKLCVSGGEEPFPVENCRQQGDNSCRYKDTLDDILAHN